MSGRVTLLALDAGNPDLVRRYAGEGHLPHLARVMSSGCTATVEHEPGLYVGSIWPTAFTGLGVDRHGFWTGVRHAPFSYDYVPAGVEGDPFWVDVSRAGKRVAVIDPPFFPARSDIDADQIIEWGCHDRYYGTASSPPELLGEVIENVGRHPMGMMDHTYERFAPCDWVHGTLAERRDAQQLAAFTEVVHDALEYRHRLSMHMADRAPYDLIVDVIAEIHCAGHQLWHLHARDHPDHDPDLAAALGGDPLLPVYRRVDRLVGEHLDRLSPSDTLYVLVSHGMRNHFDGTLLLDEVLWRLDQRYRGLPSPWLGPMTERIGRFEQRLRSLPSALGTGLLGAVARRRLGRRPCEPTEASTIPPPPSRLWFQLDNFTVCGAVRFNRRDREPAGVLGPEIERHAAEWLMDELRRLVNVDTGRPAIEATYLTDDLYRRRPEDGLPDLIVEWQRSAPIERVWSPTVGLVAAPYVGVRTGDHDRFGELHVLGPGIRGGRVGNIRGIDLAPTIAAAAGVHLADRDGRVVDELVPSAVTRRAFDRAGTELSRAALTSRRRAAARGRRRVRLSDEAAVRRELIDLRRELDGLRAAHHETRVMAHRAAQRASIVEEMTALERWLEHLPIDESLRISVITPTRDRAGVLGRAIASVRAQTYGNIEHVIVDDASNDGTQELLNVLANDQTIVVRNETALGEGGARNRGLDAASGDIVAFLDDDNSFAPNWLRTVAWLFSSRPEAQVAYGVRLVDDGARHRGLDRSDGLPELELEEWDHAEQRRRNLVDVNVLVHRRGVERFDPDLRLFTDWDYLLRLSRQSDPVRLPAIAAYYTTDRADRASVRERPDHDHWYAIVRDRWAGNAP